MNHAFALPHPYLRRGGGGHDEFFCVSSLLFPRLISRLFVSFGISRLGRGEAIKGSEVRRVPGSVAVRRKAGGEKCSSPLR